MYIIYDTETTTFPSSKIPPTHPKQARICQIACILLDDNFEEVGQFSSLIKLDKDTKMSPGAQAAHGISWDDCNEKGIKAEDALGEFYKLALQAHTSICHNVRFDEVMLALETANVFNLTIIPKQISDWLEVEKNEGAFREIICTMEASTNLCKLPFNGKKQWAGQKYKWPKLEEAYKHFFNEELVGAHDALNDVGATCRVFKYMVKEGFIKLKEFRKL
jgi:DNA polymerase-3 subunit epsilon